MTQAFGGAQQFGVSLLSNRVDCGFISILVILGDFRTWPRYLHN